MTHSVESGGTRVWNKDGEGMLQSEIRRCHAGHSIAH